MKIKIKIVPDIMPNADGEWLEIDARPNFVAFVTECKGWINTAHALRHFVPQGYHLVAVSCGDIHRREKAKGN
jgi:hypothetical protein